MAREKTSKYDFGAGLELTKHQVLRREFWMRVYADTLEVMLRLNSTEFDDIEVLEWAMTTSARNLANKALDDFDAKWSELPEGEESGC